MNHDNLLKLLKCPICLDYAEDAIECGQCNQVYCSKCYLASKINKCAVCRAPTSGFKASPMTNKLVGTLEVSCPRNCGGKFQRSDLKYHIPKCDMGDFTCTLCSFSDKREMFKTHLFTSHIDEILKKFDNLELALDPPKQLPSPKIVDEESEDEVGGDLFDW